MFSTYLSYRFFDTMVPPSWIYFLTNIMTKNNLDFLTRVSTLFCSAQPSPICSRYRSSIYLFMKIAYRIHKNLGNVRARRRENGNMILTFTSRCTIIAPRDLYNPFGSLTLIKNQKFNFDFGALFCDLGPSAPHHRDLRKNLYLQFLRFLISIRKGRFLSKIPKRTRFSIKTGRFSINLVLF